MKGENAYAFPFHYGQEAESYTFYRVPKILFTAEAFDHLSTDAKLLYGILLDRMQLSVRNHWIDADGKVFIYYPRQKIMDALTCGNKKAGQLLAELDDKNGIGLISRIHQGLGKPDKIYVHKCIVPDLKVRRPSPGEDDSPPVPAAPASRSSWTLLRSPPPGASPSPEKAPPPRPPAPARSAAVPQNEGAQKRCRQKLPRTRKKSV